MSAQPRTVGFVVPAMGFGGAERQVYTLMRSLDPERYTPVLVALNDGGYFFDAARADGIESTCLGIRGRLPVSGLTRLRAFLRQRECTLAVARGFNATTLTRLASFGSSNRLRVIVAEHSTGHSAGRSAFHGAVDRALASRTAAFVGVADAQREYLVHQKHVPADRLVIIHNGIDLAPFMSGDRAKAREALGLDTDAFVVGIVAAMRPEKDHQTFLDAAALLAERLQRARFVLVGDGPERVGIEERLAELGLLERVLLTGARHDVEQLLPAFDVVSLASVTIETLPMAIIEAMAAAIPVVATDVGGLRELVVPGRTGELVGIRDPSALAACWAHLAENPDVAQAMGAAGRDKAVHEFSGEKMVSRYEDLFDHVLTGRAVGAL
jgi:glycosyltransferase involved in cell wall biosynthesis